jgi:hypothetical protein
MKRKNTNVIFKTSEPKFYYENAAWIWEFAKSPGFLSLNAGFELVRAIGEPFSIPISHLVFGVGFSGCWTNGVTKADKRGLQAIEK